MIQKRVSALSSNKESFIDSIEPFQKALDKSGFKHKLEYENPTNMNKKKSRTRDVCWYNPPYNMNVVTRIGGTLFYLLNKHFPPGSKLHNLFNKNTVKLSYSCMPNLDTIVKGLNKRKLNGNIGKKKQDDTIECNGLGVCNKGCVANHKCEKTSVVYKATVYINDNKIYKRTYAGMTGGKFKKRIGSHYSDFKYASGKKSTSLSKFIWKLQSENTPFQIEWDTLESARSYKKGDRFCQLCVCEKK